MDALPLLLARLWNGRLLQTSHLQDSLAQTRLAQAARLRFDPAQFSRLARKL
jgi:hypothetical protein